VSRRCIDRIEGVIESGATLEDVRADRSFQQALQLLKANHEIAATGSDRIETIVRSLRNFARLDEAAFQEADVHEGLDSTLTLLDHQLRDRISVDRVYGEIPPIHCHPSELNQVFMNLLVNAIQAMEGGGTLTIRTFVERGRVHIQIGDMGVGIPSEQRERLFEPSFTRQGARMKAGMGLFTCYQIVQKHHGGITIESEVDQGTTVTITIPLGLGKTMART
jgi:signal transduction histidine kinase